MRIFLTSLMAFVLSGLAGGFVAQQLAVATGAGEEFILVFMASALVTILTTIAFFIAHFISNVARAVGVTGAAGLLLMSVAGAALFGWALSQRAVGQVGAGDLPIVAGLVLPNIATIVVQWLFVRWRVSRTPGSFATGNAAA